MVAETSQTLDRGIRLLTLVAEASGGLTINEAATSLGVNRTVVYRLATTLEQHGFVRRADNGRISLGFGVLALAGRVHPLLRHAALPVLRALAEDVGATAHLTVADGGEALAVAVVEPTWTDFHVAYRVGSRHDLRRGAAGRAILAGRAGDLSFLVSEGELQPGAQGVAAAVAGVPNIEASVGVVALTGLDVAAAGPRVVAAAAEVARRLR
ncbi:MAG TPA: helix-turn-helix domain-containing protein [Jiangellaceae bacterium]|nr:helix-turn-helix domain-containing protein [Jiangellaceae bacterium]